MLESADDRSEFFSLDDFAVNCLLVGPGYSKTIPVIMNAISDPVTLYDTNVEAPHPNFLCRAEDIADLERRQIKQYTATIQGTLYQLVRLTDDQDGYLVTAYLFKPSAIENLSNARWANGRHDQAKDS